MDPYTVRQLDADGEVLSEKRVEAQNYDGVLRQLKKIAREVRRIEVYDQDGNRAGEINADFWRQRVRGR